MPDVSDHLISYQHSEYFEHFQKNFKPKVRKNKKVLRNVCGTSNLQKVLRKAKFIITLKPLTKLTTPLFKKIILKIDYILLL